MNITSVVPTVLKFIAAILVTVALLGVGFTAVKNFTAAGAKATENAFQAGLGVSVDTGIGKDKTEDKSGLSGLGGEGISNLEGFNFN